MESAVELVLVTRPHIDLVRVAGALCR